MNCPDCENNFSYQIIYDTDGAEEGEPFNCPSCNVLLRLVVDEGTYFGAQDQYLEVIDDQ